MLNQMDHHSVQSDSRLEVSVSFGRFENDALSWEKWSSFSPNKYLEEVGSLSTPGSVAQKKAYFEAHYKKIAAQKAEILEQEKQNESDFPSPDVVLSKQVCGNNSSEEIYSGISNGVKLVEEASEESCLSALPSEDIAEEVEDDNEAISFEFIESGACKLDSDAGIISLEQKANGDTSMNDNNHVHHPESTVKQDIESEMVDISSKDPLVDGEKFYDRKDFILKKPSAVKKVNSKVSNTRDVVRKVTPTKKEGNLSGTKKKVVSPATKQLPTSVSSPRNAKLVLKSTPTSGSQSLKKKVNGSPQTMSKHSLVGDNKRISPIALHSSLNSGPANSLAALSMTRKSLIMEKMGDKDIVKRAFKSFQKRDDGSSPFADKPSTTKHESSTSIAPRITISRTPVKGNERVKKDSETRITSRSPSESRSNPLPPGSQKMSTLGKSYTTSFSPRTLMISEKADKRREKFLKKLEANSIARVAENVNHARISKVGVKN